MPGTHLHLSAIDGAANARTAKPLTPRRIGAAKDVGELYLTMFQAGADTYARCLQLFADPNTHGVAFFCMAGKDRTGTLAALVHGLLGVATEDIVADYALTETVADAIEQRSRAEEPDLHGLPP